MDLCIFYVYSEQFQKENLRTEAQIGKNKEHQASAKIYWFMWQRCKYAL